MHKAYLISDHPNEFALHLQYKIASEKRNGCEFDRVPLFN